MSTGDDVERELRIAREREHFESALAHLPGAATSLKRLRQAAMNRFLEVGYPSRKSEDFRYTNVDPIVESDFVPRCSAGEVDSVPSEALARDAASRLVFVDGVYSEGLSRVAATRGVELARLGAHVDDVGVAEALGSTGSGEDHGFLALNTALFTDGVLLRVAKNTRAAEPIHVLHLTTDAAKGSASYCRALVVMEEGAEATLVEEYLALSSVKYLNSAVTEVLVGANAKLMHLKSTRESSYHLSSVRARVERDGSFGSFSLALGGEIVRTEQHTLLAGEGASTSLNGVYLPRDRGLFDHHTFVDHAVPRCMSNQLYKGVLIDATRGVFNGKVLVRRDAQQTVAYQQNRNLVLSDNAVADTRPQLEIYADDVKCSHGATLGELDSEAMFYLRSRGLDVPSARGLLMGAFVGEVLEPLDALGETLAVRARELVAAALPRGDVS